MKLYALWLVMLLSHGAQAGEVWRGSYPEGPIWIRDQLYWAEMTADRVMTWDGHAPKPFIEHEGCGPTSLTPLGEDQILVLCHLLPGLLVLDRDGALKSVIQRDAQGVPLRDPNDASADGNRGVWFTDPGTFWSQAPATGRLMHLSPSGDLTEHVDELAYGNGVWTLPDAVLVSEHLARRVLRFPQTDQGLGAPVVVIDLNALGLPDVSYPEAGPDGLEIDPQGRLWVAEYGAGRLLVFDASYRFLGHVPVEMPFVTNIAFGPNGLAAVTGAYQNTRNPYEGAILLTSVDALFAMMQTRAGQ